MGKKTNCQARKRGIIAMTDNIINFQDIKTELEKTRYNLSSLSFEEATVLTTEQLANNLIIISDTLEKTIDVIKMLKDKVEALENDMGVLL